MSNTIPPMMKAMMKQLIHCCRAFKCIGAAHEKERQELIFLILLPKIKAIPDSKVAPCVFFADPFSICFFFSFFPPRVRFIGFLGEFCDGFHTDADISRMRNYSQFSHKS